MAEVKRVVRRRQARHWRQRFNPSMPLIFRRSTTVGVTQYSVGDPVPAEVDPRKLRAWWNARRVELGEWYPPLDQDIEDEETRISKLREAIMEVDPEDETLWSKDGGPKQTVLEKIAGFKPSKEERAQLLKELLGGKSDADDS